jgi:segregation and condensation protein B
MSLKAKLEAVIYAAEEPVTLAQLAALFGDEALEWKAEQAAATAEAEASAAEPSESQPLIDEGLGYLGLEESPAVYADREAAEAAGVSDAQAALRGLGNSTEDSDAASVEGMGAVESAPEGEQSKEGDSTSQASEAVVDAEAEAKRLARQRDREVKSILRGLLDALIATYVSDGRGIEVREIAGGYRMATKPECHDAVRLFIKSLKPQMKLSLPALETLAVIAYKQPVTAPEVNEIRGVDSSGVFGSLLSRKLITTAGRKAVIGRPILYKTTKEFLLRFGLKDVSELPSMEEFEKMAAIELDETADDSEVDSGYEPGPDAGPELDESSSEDPEGATAVAEAAGPAPAGTSEPTQGEAEKPPHD